MVGNPVLVADIQPPATLYEWAKSGNKHTIHNQADYHKLSRHLLRLPLRHFQACRIWILFKAAGTLLIISYNHTMTIS